VNPVNSEVHQRSVQLVKYILSELLQQSRKQHLNSQKSTT